MPARELQLDPQGRIDEDLHCGQCGYNLRRSPIDGQCGECGQPIRKTARPDLLQLASPSALKRLWRGVFISILTIAIYIVIMLASWVFITTMSMVGQWQWTVFTLVGMLAPLSFYVGMWLATWVFTTRITGIKDPAIRPLARGAVTFMAGVAVLATVIVTAIEMSDIVFSQTTQYLGPIISMLFMGTLALVVPYVKLIARRIPDQRFARWVVIIATGVIACGIALAGLNVISIIYITYLIDNMSVNAIETDIPFIVIRGIGLVVGITFLVLCIWAIVLAIKFYRRLKRVPTTPPPISPPPDATTAPLLLDESMAT